VALYAVSDLHILGPDDPLYRSLLKLLREQAKPGDTVVLAGDLFDLFVGNKKVFVERYRGFLEALGEAGRGGVRIHYIEGNHDFHLRRVFAAIPGLQLHSHDFDLELGGRKFHFSHGDLADRKDYGYRVLRAVFRSPFMKAFVTLAPGSVVEWIGTTSSRKSQASKPRLPTSLPPGRMEYLRNVYRSYAAEHLARGCDYVVMGHCHDLDEKCFLIDGRPGQYMNVGFPRVHGSFLSWSPGDEKIHRERLPE
jgi:UDP-2,3-diacylglucosamine hydrolase